MKCLIIALIPLMFSSSFALSGFDIEPGFTPQYDWSINLIKLFNQAVNNSYGSREIIILSASQGNQTDGFLIPNELNCEIHYAYVIDWAVFNGHIGFLCQNLSSEEVLNNIEESLPDWLKITEVIDANEALSKCGDVFPALNSPWYNDVNNLYYDPVSNQALFNCYRTINEAENKCSIESYSLLNGSMLSTSEGACIVYGTNNSTYVNNSMLTWILIIIILVILALIILVKHKIN